MLRYLPFEELTREIVNGLAGSFVYRHQRELELLGMLASGHYKVFVFSPDDEPVYFAVSVLQDGGERQLSLDAVWLAGGAGWKWKSWLEWLGKLAKDWDCAALVTAVQDCRRAGLLTKLGVELEYAAMRMEIKDGQ